MPGDQLDLLLRAAALAAAGMQLQASPPLQKFAATCSQRTLVAARPNNPKHTEAAP